LSLDDFSLQHSIYLGAHLQGVGKALGTYATRK
jgi:hypothetical protein